MATQGYRLDQTVDSAAEEERGSGWLVLAVTLLALAGTFSVIDGIVAISKSRFFVADAVFVFGDLNTWGWIVLVLGSLQLLAAFTVMRGSEFARWFGMVMAGLNALGQLLFVQAYPFWALSIFAVDILVIYALAVYGGSRLRVD